MKRKIYVEFWEEGGKRQAAVWGGEEGTIPAREMVHGTMRTRLWFDTETQAELERVNYLMGK